MVTNFGVPSASLDDNKPESVVAGTSGVAFFQVKSNFGAFQISSENKYGEVVFLGNIDPTISMLTAQLAQQYVNYRIRRLVISVRNVAPFSSASGSVQFAYINDPNNIVVTDPNAVDAIIRQATSKQVGAKDTLEMVLDSASLNVDGAPSEWKFCRVHNDPVFNRYGTVVAAVRGVPAIGDGSQFVVSLAADVEFKGMTFNLAPQSVGHFYRPSIEPFDLYTAVYGPDFGSQVLTVTVPVLEAPTFPEGVFFKAYTAPIMDLDVVVRETDAPSRELTYRLQLQSLDVKVEKGLMLLRFSAVSSRLQQLNRPLTVGVRLNATPFLLVYAPVEHSQLMDDYSITPQVATDLALLTAVHKYVVDIRADLFRQMQRANSGAPKRGSAGGVSGGDSGR